ncbi:hypothetical protein HmCmsJML254_03953 [Escherichia coli]|nr:hypothetical protein HmCmsJML254_03953 [Escherichia coli]
MCCRCRKGMFGIYDCRECSVGRKFLLVFLAGFLLGGRCYLGVAMHIWIVRNVIVYQNNFAVYLFIMF